jgi:hypothetical protein
MALMGRVLKWAAGAPGQHRLVDRLQAVVVGNARVHPVQRHPLEAQQRARRRLAQGQHQARPPVRQRGVQRLQAVREAAGQLHGADAVQAVEAAGDLPAAVEGIAAKGLEAGQQHAHGRLPDPASEPASGLRFGARAMVMVAARIRGQGALPTLAAPLQNRASDHERHRPPEDPA